METDPAQEAAASVAESQATAPVSRRCLRAMSPCFTMSHSSRTAPLGGFCLLQSSWRSKEPTLSVQSKPSWEKTATVDLIKGHTPSFRLRRPDSRCVAMHHVYTVRKALSSAHSRFSSLMERTSDVGDDLAQDVQGKRAHESEQSFVAQRGRGRLRGGSALHEDEGGEGEREVARGEATVRVFSGGAPLSPIDNSRAPRSINRKEDETGTASATTP